MKAEIYPLTIILSAGVGKAEFASPCRTGLYQASKKDRALTGHVLDVLKVTDEIACGRLCLHRNGCVSYNYQFENYNGTFHKCELNSQTKEAKPEAFQEKHGFLYFGSLNEREKGTGCAHNNCYNGGTCVDICHGEMFYCQCPKLFRGKHCERPKAHSCKELMELGDIKDGVKRIAPDDSGDDVSVYCDQTTDGGGWTLVQRRSSPFTNLFSKNWAEYEAGFGEVNSSFWLGNMILSRLTATPVKLRIELTESSSNQQGFAVYQNFSISAPEDNYRLSVGSYVGNIGNAISGDPNPAFVQNGMQFSTSNRDNDANKYGNCASVNGNSGWWFSHCGRVNLNKVSSVPQWDDWIYFATISYTEMKIRPY